MGEGMARQWHMREELQAPCQLGSPGDKIRVRHLAADKSLEPNQGIVTYRHVAERGRSFEPVNPTCKP